MSFDFKWPEFSRQFHADAAAMLDSALNRGPKPKVIADDIKVEDINMGSIPPELDMLEIGELSTDRFRGIFRLTYAGNAHLLLSTKVQANPLTRPTPDGATSQFEDVSSAFPTSMPSRGILFAARPLVVPMKLRLSQMRLKAIVVLVVSKQKGITLVFKNDPLESVDVSSTFDSVAVIQKYLQQEIEGQLREMFREDLPGIIHRLSQRWLSSQSRGAGDGDKRQAATKLHKDQVSSPPLGAVAAPKAPMDKRERSTSGVSSRARRESESKPVNLDARSPARRRKSERAASAAPSSPRLSHRTSSNLLPARETPRTPSKKIQAQETNKGKATKVSQSPQKQLEEPEESFSYSSSTGSAGAFGSDFALDVARYDPTYGLRPDEVRMSASGSKYSGLAKLAGRTVRGLGDLMISEEPEKEQDHVEEPSYAFDESADDSAILDQPSDDEDELAIEDKDVIADGHNYEEGAIHAEDSDDVPDCPLSDEDEAPVEGTRINVSDYDEDAADLDYHSTSEDEEADSSRPEYPHLGGGSYDDSLEAHVRRSASLFAPSISGSNRSTVRKAGASQLRSSSSAAGSRRARGSRQTHVEYETIPAVGGGTITRPRVYHIASTVQAPDIEEEDEVAATYGAGSVVASSTARGPASSRTINGPWRVRDDQLDDYGYREEGNEDAYDQSTSESPSAIGHASLATLDPEPMDPTSRAYKAHIYRHQSGGLYRPGYDKYSSTSATDPSSGASTRASLAHRQYDGSASGPSTAPTSSHPSIRITSQDKASPARDRSLSGSLGWDPSQPSPSTSPAKGRVASSGSTNAMTLDASNHFMDLVNSNHTLSPFTRTLDTKGFAVRSHPLTPGGSQSMASRSSNGLSRAGSFSALQAGSAHPTGARTGASTPQMTSQRPSYTRAPASVASATSSGSATGGRRRVFRLGSSADTSKVASGANTPASSVANGNAGNDRHDKSLRAMGRSQSSTSLERVHSSTGNSSSGAASSRASSVSGGGWRNGGVHGMEPLTSSPLVNSVAPTKQTKRHQQLPPRRPPLDMSRRRSAAIFGEDYVTRTMGSIRE